MQKSPYFPSPLRKDYTTKPLRNFIPVIPPQPQNTSGVKNDSNRKQSNKRQKQTSPQKKPQHLQKSIRYQDGLLVSILKNGNKQSGLFFMNSNACMIYSLQQQVPQGKNYIFYPSGVIMSLYYQKGVLCWVVSYCEKKFIGCYHYRRGFREGEQYFYDYKDKMLIVSMYRRGNLTQIKNGHIGQFDKVVKNQQIIKRVSELRNQNLELPKKFPVINTDKISYYGQVDEKKENPHGFGILLTNRQLFIGNFNKGFLNGLGCIKFKNNNYYYGNFINGVFEGYGSITDSKNTIYKFGQIQIQQIQFQAYINQNTPPQLQQQWLDKYKELEKFHQQFKNKYQFINQNNKSKQEQEQEQGQEQDQDQDQEQQKLSQRILRQDQIQPSQFNLQIDDSEKQYDDLNYSPETTPYNSKIPKKNQKKVNNIPKLSLFQKLDDKNRKKGIDSLDGAQRKKQRQQQQRHKTMTERKQKQKNQKITLNIPKQQNRSRAKPNNNQYYESAQFQQQQNDLKQDYSSGWKKKKQKNPERITSPRQQIRSQNLGLDKWHVSSQTNFIKPHQSTFKVKLQDNYKNYPHNANPNEWKKYKLEKNDNDTRINKGKLQKASSDVSDKNQEQFLQQILTRNNQEDY